MPKPAVKPHLQPFVDAIDAFLLERRIRRPQMTEMIYGRNEKGHIKHSYFRSIAAGKTRPGAKTIALIRKKTGLDLSHVRPLPPGAESPSTPAKTALAQFTAAEHVPASAPPEPSGRVTLMVPRAPPVPAARVSLMVTRTTGETVLSLTDVTVEQAVRILQSAVSSGLA